MSIFPKEHGAYGQMAFPLLTSLVVAGVTVPAALIAAGVCAGFFAHEPLLVLLGRRGLRAQREERRRAIVWFAATATLTVVAIALGAWLMPIGGRWSLLLPLAPGVFLGAAVAAQREKSSWGEIAVALAFSLAAAPICIAAGASTSTALSVAIAFAAIFVAATLAVRVVILKVRGGGNPRAAHLTRLTVFVSSGAVAIALATAAVNLLLPWTTVLAAGPGLAGALWLACFPPSPRRLHRVGWALVTMSAATAAILIAGLDR
jgi:hypothetical protein